MKREETNNVIQQQPCFLKHHRHSWRMMKLVSTDVLYFSVYGDFTPEVYMGRSVGENTELHLCGRKQTQSFNKHKETGVSVVSKQR